ncbi:helix-turn-helix domain-containing protein [Ningiella sp. W23]|uniref:helix-turn-helix domain-containing protein n=1 Tax=Ningiella sp. W23 TaxID=3023715 RepID=UPI0037566B13
MTLESLGKEITRLRKERNVSQQQMSTDLAISRATISALENGRCGDIGYVKLSHILNYVGKEFSIRDKSPFMTFEELRDAR